MPMSRSETNKRHWAKGGRLKAMARDRAKIGFTPELVARLREEQGGKCAMPGCGVEMVIGGREANSECADHCHVTGKPRGLICKRCNTKLGAWEHLEIDDAARRYLAKF